MSQLPIFNKLIKKKKRIGIKVIPELEGLQSFPVSWSVLIDGIVRAMALRGWISENTEVL